MDMKVVSESSGKLLKVITELHAPKNQKNNFGNYNYRSCEDILEAVKPLLKVNNLCMNISDKVVNIGEFNYVEATVKVWDIETGSIWESTAYAREAKIKKGMDDSQITGATSSYARKYALNGMFLIDDTKDADSMDNSKVDQVKNTFNATDYTDYESQLDNSASMDELKHHWGNTWKALEGDDYGRHHLQNVYNKRKLELAK